MVFNYYSIISDCWLILRHIWSIILCFLFNLCWQIMIAIVIKWITYARGSIYSAIAHRFVIIPGCRSRDTIVQFIWMAVLRETSVLREMVRPMNFSLPEQNISRNSHTRNQHFHTFRYDLWMCTCQPNKTTQWRKNI